MTALQIVHILWNVKAPAVDARVCARVDAAGAFRFVHGAKERERSAKEVRKDAKGARKAAKVRTWENARKNHRDFLHQVLWEGIPHEVIPDTFIAGNTEKCRDTRQKCVVEREFSTMSLNFVVGSKLCSTILNGIHQKQKRISASIKSVSSALLKSFWTPTCCLSKTRNTVRRKTAG